jgi:phosphoenolpyruvate carboxykinase (ATP)
MTYVNTISLEQYGIELEQEFIIRNPSVPAIYEYANHYESKQTMITSTGALAANSAKYKGRSPADKRIVDQEDIHDDVDWGNINIAMSEDVFVINKQRAIDYMNTRERLFVIDAYAGWDENYRISVRVITTRAYHALFMTNMLIRPTLEELDDFEAEWVVFNSGEFPVNRYTTGMKKHDASVDLNFGTKELVILGTQYAGEMKKGIFTVMNYMMPKIGHLSMHSSCNVDVNGNSCIFFGLSGTGKTTLSTDPNRFLIGDDEHVWKEDGVFNMDVDVMLKQ